MYNKRIWLNKPSSSSQGSMCAYDGVITCEGKEVRSTFLSISDCYVSAKLHKSEDDNMYDFIDKLKLLRDEIQLFINYLDVNRSITVILGGNSSTRAEAVAEIIVGKEAVVLDSSLKGTPGYFGNVTANTNYLILEVEKASEIDHMLLVSKTIQLDKMNVETEIIDRPDVIIVSKKLKASDFKIKNGRIIECIV